MLQCEEERPCIVGCFWAAQVVSTVCCSHNVRTLSPVGTCGRMIDLAVSIHQELHAWADVLDKNDTPSSCPL